MAKQRISIAMCTYNGEAYLTEQLDSIIAQSRPADEIVICDDGSTDNTWQILQRYEQRYPNLIRLYRNDANLGVSKNFEKAISLCTKDLIALSDQDDVWRRDKLEKLVQKFEADPCLGLLFSNAKRIDAESNLLDGDLWQMVGLDRRRKAAIKSGYFFQDLLRRPLVTGCTTMFNAKLRGICLPVEGDLHDYWISLLAAATSRIDFVDERLVNYRQHSSNVIGARRSTLTLKRRLKTSRWQQRMRIPQYSQELKLAEKLMSRVDSSDHKQLSLLKKSPASRSVGPKPDQERPKLWLLAPKTEGTKRHKVVSQPAQLILIQEKIDYLKFRIWLESSRGSWRQQISSLVYNWFRGRYKRYAWNRWYALARDLAVLVGIIKCSSSELPSVRTK